MSKHHLKNLSAVIFCLLTVIPAIADDNISVKKSNKALTLMRGDTPILTYHTAEVPPPDGLKRGTCKNPGG